MVINRELFTLGWLIALIVLVVVVILLVTGHALDRNIILALIGGLAVARLVP